MRSRNSGFNGFSGDPSPSLPPRLFRGARGFGARRLDERLITAAASAAAARGVLIEMGLSPAGGYGSALVSLLD